MCAGDSYWHKTRAKHPSTGKGEALQQLGMLSKHPILANKLHIFTGSYIRSCVHMLHVYPGLPLISAKIKELDCLTF